MYLIKRLVSVQLSCPCPTDSGSIPQHWTPSWFDPAPVGLLLCVMYALDLDRRKSPECFPHAGDRVGKHFKMSQLEH